MLLLAPILALLSSRALAAQATGDGSTRALEAPANATEARPGGGDKNATAAAATCLFPPACPVCECSDEDTDCILSKAVEACASKAFEACYADLVPPGFDARGLCAVQCGGDAAAAGEDVASSVRLLCRMCDVFACCTDCPSEEAARCFPSTIADGFTPAGWEPLACGGARASAATPGRVRRALPSLMAFVSFAAFGLSV